MHVESIPPETLANRQFAVLLCLLLLVVILVVYGPLHGFSFVNIDDDLYVTENSYVRNGVTWDNLKWSFQSFHSSNWHPLTWLSHLVDVELYGLDAGNHHLTSVLFHIANTLLLFILLKSMTGAFWPSMIVVAMFALHPLHVESVAWISERKDVLSTFLGILSLIGYVRYTQQHSRAGYAMALLFFILGLMAKPMLVTWPFLMLLLDYWPLRRFEIDSRFHLRPSGGFSTVYFLILEKLPFFVFSAASCFVTYYAQKGGGAVMPFEVYPMGMRVANAVFAYVGYIGKMLWPANLAIFYPPTESFVFWQVAGASAVLLSLSLGVLVQIRQRPYLAVGWFWYIGTLVPVIGLVQVGSQAMADRYTYLPLIGLFIMIVWGAAEILNRWRIKRIFAVITIVVLMSGLSVISRLQVGHWANSITLFSHALAVTRQNALAHNNLAVALLETGRYDEALTHLNSVIALVPHNGRAYNNLGYLLLQQGDTAEAIRHFQQAIKLYPQYPKAYYNWATALMASGKLDEALSHYQTALELDPDNPDILNDLANAMFSQGRFTEALSYYSKALKLKPKDSEIHNNIGVALISLGRLNEAVIHFRMALRLNPDYLDASKNLDRALKVQPTIAE